MLVGARLAQGLGAALMLPAALSMLTTRFTQASERRAALGVWGGVGGLASAAGVLFGGLLTEEPRLALGDVRQPGRDRVRARRDQGADRARRAPAAAAGFDAAGALLVTSGMLLLVFALVRAPTVGWGAAGTVAELAGALMLLRVRRQRVAWSQCAGAAVDLPHRRARRLRRDPLIAFAGLIAMFFFLTLYMQNVLGYSPIQTGTAYLPLVHRRGGRRRLTRH